MNSRVLQELLCLVLQELPYLSVVESLLPGEAFGESLIEILQRQRC